MNRWQKRGVPKRRTDCRRHVGTKDDKPGKVLIFRSETVRQPRTQTRPASLAEPGIHHEHGWLMVRDIGVHRPNEADIIRALADLREQFADIHSALAVFLEREWRAHQCACLAFRR